MTACCSDLAPIEASATCSRFRLSTRLLLISLVDAVVAAAAVVVVVVDEREQASWHRTA